VNFTSDYLKNFELQMAATSSPAALKAAMEKSYPEIGATSVLDLSSKVIKADMAWPQCSRPGSQVVRT
jgi:hypothetical protein